MKRISILIVVVFILCFTVLSPISANASEVKANNPRIIYFDDGSYAVIEIFTLDTRATSTRVGYKTYTYYQADGQVEWIAKLTATFEYDKTTASCVSAYCDITIEDSSWQIGTNNVTRSGATATANVTMLQKFLGITINTESTVISLTCDPNGNFS